jgi:hypothetical protein
MTAVFFRSLACAALAAAVCAPAAAQTLTKRKPGLWEVQTTTQGQGAGAGQQPPNMKEMMESMPPAQRAQVEKMMKERGVGMASKPNSFRYCMTKEQAERDPSVSPDPDTQCSNKMNASSPKEATFSFQCTRKDGSTMQGEGRAYDLTPESYAMDMRMQMQHQGQPMQMQIQQKGRWLGADCQGIKPIGEGKGHGKGQGQGGGRE